MAAPDRRSVSGRPLFSYRLFRPSSEAGGWGSAGPLGGAGRARSASTLAATQSPATTIASIPRIAYPSDPEVIDCVPK